MADVFGKSKRSEVMSRIKGRGNRDTELAFMALMKAHRVTGWRRHVAISLTSARSAEGMGRRSRSLKVRPDFVFPKLRLAVFVDGCFWHGCPRHSAEPSSNRAFWQVKLSANTKRDRFVTRSLRKRGWIVLRVWEHELRRPSVVCRRLQRYLDVAKSV